MPLSEWTIETLKAHLDLEIHDLARLIDSQRIDDQRALTLVQTSSERALDLATQQMDARMEKLNEFRGALSDAQLHMMPRAEAKLLIDTLAVRIDGVTNTVTNLGSLLTALRAGLQGQDQGSTDEIRAAERSRNLAFAAVGILLTCVVIVVSLYVGLHPKATPPTSTPSTSTPSSTTTK